MESNIIKIYPNELSGPRSFFTDIDPYDKNYVKEDAIRKLKLQLLTKGKIVVAASSLFHDIWLQLFRENSNLILALEDGIIIPAIRNQFEGVNEFFENKNYGEENKNFFTKHIRYSIPWDLEENTSWFKHYFIKGLKDENSVLRKQGNITRDQATAILDQIEELIELEPNDSRFLQRKHIEETARKYDSKIEQFLINYANLIYRLSGSRVVNSEGHFPQSNLTNLELVSNDKLLSDDSIFWDIYAEAVFTYLGAAIRLTPERLDNLNFKDILSIRKTFFDTGFSSEYDNLIGKVKKETELTDPDKLILHMQEITELAIRLQKAFSEKVQIELSIKDTSARENSLWQVANILSLIDSQNVGLVVGVLSALKSIPEITASISDKLTNSLEIRMQWIRDFINSRIGWSASQRKLFLDAYKELALYGLR